MLPKRQEGVKLELFLYPLDDYLISLTNLEKKKSLHEARTMPSFSNQKVKFTGGDR